MNTARTKNRLLGNGFHIRRGLAFGVIIIAALIAFEIFNYSTTDFALSDLLGDLKFMGIRWATILSIAFCGIDFAGIARLFTPEDSGTGNGGHNEVWYLFGAWLLAATMNAMLTWWGVSLAILGNHTLGNAVIDREIMLRVVPIFVAVLVWLIRVLIIGTFSVAGDRLFSQDANLLPTGRGSYLKTSSKPMPSRSLNNSRAQSPLSAASSPKPAHRPAPKPSSRPLDSSYTNRSELTYHSLSMSPSNPQRK
jgi:hypothetical protein